MEDKDRLMGVLSDEFRYIALQAVSSNKAQVEEKICVEVMKHMSRSGFTYRNGTTKAEMLKRFTDCPINIFAQIVDGADSIEKFKSDITDLMSPAYRRRNWRDIETCFGIQWKFKFNYPKNLYDSKINSRTYKSRRVDGDKIKHPPADPLLQIPLEVREYIQKIGEASPMQRKLVDFILNNPLPKSVVGARMKVEDGVYISLQFE